MKYLVYLVYNHIFKIIRDNNNIDIIQTKYRYLFSKRNNKSKYASPLRYTFTLNLAKMEYRTTKI